MSNLEINFNLPLPCSMKHADRPHPELEKVFNCTCAHSCLEKFYAFCDLS